MLELCRCNGFLNRDQLAMRRCQVNLRLTNRRADVARDVQVEIVLLDLGHLHPAGIAERFPAERPKDRFERSINPIAIV